MPTGATLLLTNQLISTFGIPNTFPPYTLHDAPALGFGFDPIDFDFKVVRAVSSAITYVWRNIDPKLIDIPYRNKFEICLHGFLFAIGHNGV